MFGKHKKGKQTTICAPMDGELISVAEVADPTFSEEVLGRGIAIRPSGGRVVSPVTGTVTQMFRTGHAVTLTSDDGAEVLIHIGLDTVKLKGEHFKPCASEGDPVAPGDLLIEFDREKIAEAGYDTVSPMVICNSDDYKSMEAQTGRPVKEGEEIVTLSK